MTGKQRQAEDNSFKRTMGGAESNENQCRLSGPFCFSYWQSSERAFKHKKIIRYYNKNDHRSGGAVKEGCPHKAYNKA